jgi:coiled-coil domain-containing protein 55
VTKQKDLSGFYRNLLNNNISADSTNSKTELSDSPNEVTKTSSKQKPNRQIRRRRSSSEESSDSSVDEDNDNIQNKTNTTQKVDNKLESNKKVKHDSESNSNSDSNDSSVDSPKIKSHNNQEIVENRSHHSIDSSLEIDSPKDKINNEINSKTPKLDKRAILIKKFTKRTIGDVFEAAKQRYFERKDKYLIE